MRPNLPFRSASSNALLKPGGLLRWKVRLVKKVRLSLPLTKVMKIARLTSPLLDVPRQSSLSPRLRYGRRLALFSRLNLTLNLYTLFFTLSLALFLVFVFSYYPQLFFSQGIGFGLCRLPEISFFHFSAKDAA